VLFLAVPWGSITSLTSSAADGNFWLLFLSYIFKFMKSYVTSRSPPGVIDDVMHNFVMFQCGSIESVCNFCRKCCLSAWCCCCIWSCDVTCDCALCCDVWWRATRLFAGTGTLLGTCVGMIIGWGYLECDYNATIGIVLIAVLSCCGCYKGCKEGCKTGFEAAGLPGLDHSLLVLTSPQNWVVITYDMVDLPTPWLDKCTHLANKPPDLATLVVPMRHPSTFIEEALRAQWLAKGVDSSYVEKSVLTQPGTTNPLYKFNGTIQDQAMHSLEDPSDAQRLLDAENSGAMQTQRSAQRAAANLASEYGLDSLADDMLEFEIKRNSIALSYSEYLAILDARTDEAKMIADKVHAHDDTESREIVQATAALVSSSEQQQQEEEEAKHAGAAAEGEASFFPLSVDLSSASFFGGGEGDGDGVELAAVEKMEARPTVEVELAAVYKQDSTVLGSEQDDSQKEKSGWFRW